MTDDYEKSEIYDWLNEEDNDDEPYPYSEFRWYHYAGLILLFVLFILAGIGDVPQ